MLYVRVWAVNAQIKAAIVGSFYTDFDSAERGAIQHHKAHYNLNLLQITACLLMSINAFNAVFMVF